MDSEEKKSFHWKMLLDYLPSKKNTINVGLFIAAAAALRFFGHNLDSAPWVRDLKETGIREWRIQTGQIDPSTTRM